MDGALPILALVIGLEVVIILTKYSCPVQIHQGVSSPCGGGPLAFFFLLDCRLGCREKRGGGGHRLKIPPPIWSWLP